MASFNTPWERALEETFIIPSGLPIWVGMPTRLPMTSATPGMLAQPPQIRICSGCSRLVPEARKNCSERLTCWVMSSMNGSRISGS